MGGRLSQLGQKGEKVVGCDIRTWTADGHAFECDGVLSATADKTLILWDASTRQIKTIDVDSGSNL